ncbi:MAG TPA: alanine racemase [Solirubrobacteraceae bacterium]|nr:alanine racemase [Solirubrobacteraceae bacterium]
MHVQAHAVPGTVDPPARLFIGQSLRELPTPALLLDVAAMRDNLAAMATWSKDHAAIRPHFKVHKSVHIAREQIAAGAIGMTAATIWEAESLVAGGINDVLIANEVVGEAKLERLAGLARGARMTVAVDHPDVVSALARAGQNQSSTVGVLVEVDVGMHRGGVRSIAQARSLAGVVAGIRGVELRGVMGYEGHVVLEPDRQRRTDLAREAMDFLATYVQALQDDGHRIEIVSAGGTNTYDMTGVHPCVTELQAGTYAVVDHTYARLAPAFRPALSVLATVVSRNGGTAILDCGTKVVAVDVAPPHSPIGRVREVHEEHTLLDVEEGGPPAVGEVLELVVGYSGGTVNLHDVYFVASGDEIVDVWPISARGPGWTNPRPTGGAGR